MSWVYSAGPSSECACGAEAEPAPTLHTQDKPPPLAAALSWYPDLFHATLGTGSGRGPLDGAPSLFLLRFRAAFGRRMCRMVRHSPVAVLSHSSLQSVALPPPHPLPPPAQVAWLKDIPRCVHGDCDTLRLAVQARGALPFPEDRARLLQLAAKGADETARDAMDAAVAQGDREAMEWLAASGFKGSTRALEHAASRRDTELLSWLEDLGGRGDTAALYAAAVTAGDVAVLEFVEGQGYEMEDVPAAEAEELVWHAVQHDAVGAVAWLQDRGVHGARGETRYVAQAVARGCAAMVERLCASGYAAAGDPGLLQGLLAVEADGRMLETVLEHCPDVLRSGSKWEPMEDSSKLRVGDVVCEEGLQSDEERHIVVDDGDYCQICGNYAGKRSYGSCHRSPCPPRDKAFVKRVSAEVSLAPNVLEHLLVQFRDGAPAAALVPRVAAVLRHATPAALTTDAWEEVLPIPALCAAVSEHQKPGTGLTQWVREAGAVDAALSQRYGLATLG